MNHLHPAFVLFIVAVVVALTRGRRRQVVLLVGVTAGLVALLRLTPDTTWTVSMPPYTLHLLHVDRLSQVFGLIFSLITCIGVLFALHLKTSGEPVATLVYAGGSLGVVLAGDWLTLFVFWELMAIASLFVVWYGGTSRSRQAGLRYLMVHIFGGSLLLVGILLYLADGGAMSLHALTDAAIQPVAFWCILLGVVINAAVPPLHAWLADAYPEASVTGSVFLSAYTTKTAVYVLIRLFPGTEVLLWSGVTMTLYGVFYAILENDIRRLLAYHIISQVGYMVAAVGIGTAMALNGSTAHAFCHILYKALLFMGAGSVMQATGKRKLTELGGLAHAMPVVMALYMIGAFSISGLPLFNGFISKSMVISAASDAHLPVAELLLTLASIGTFFSIGLKLPYFTFYAPDRALQPKPIPKNMTFAMAVTAFLCIVLGIFPALLYARLPFHVDYHPYTVDHVVSALQLLLGTALGFYLLLPKLGGEATVSVDTDWLYRKPLALAFNTTVGMARRMGSTIEHRRTRLLETFIPYFQNPFLALQRLRLVGRRQSNSLPAPQRMTYDENTYRLPIGVTVFWIVVFFACLSLYNL